MSEIISKVKVEISAAIGLFELAVLISLYSVFSLFGIFVLILYAFVVNSLFVGAFGLLEMFVSAVFPWLQTHAVEYSFVLLAILIIILNFILLFWFIVAVSIIFIISPFQIYSAVRSSRGRADESVKQASEAASRAVGIEPFSTMIACPDYYVGVLGIAGVSVLCFDRSIIDALGKDKAASIMAHEYGHLRSRGSIPCVFLGYASMFVRFLRAQLATEDDAAPFRRIIRAVTVFYPPIVQDGSREVSYHLGRLLCRFQDVWVKQLIKLYRNEFHEAEYGFDAAAHRAFGKRFDTALIEVAMLQYITKARRSGCDDSQIAVGWRGIYTLESASHPSLESRLRELRAEKLQGTGFQAELLSTLLRVAASRPDIASGERPLLQSLSVAEFELPEFPDASNRAHDNEPGTVQ